MIVSGKVVRFHAIKPTLERNRYLALFHLRGFIHPTIAKRYIQGAAAGWAQGFVNCFLKVPPCLLGQHISCSTAQRPVELSENILQNLVHNLLPHLVEP